MTLHPQYITDSKGRKTAVLLPYNEYEELLKSVDRPKKELKPKKVSDDWFVQLNKAQQKSILRGLKDIEQGKVSTHKEVSAKVKALLKKAKS